MKFAYKKFGIGQINKTPEDLLVIEIPGWSADNYMVSKG